MVRGVGVAKQTPLAVFVRRRLAELELKQSDFCRLTGFDQGLLSKIQNSVITSLSLESALHLAVGLSVSPKVIFKLTNRRDFHDLVIRSYAAELFPGLTEVDGVQIPPPVLEVSRFGLCVYLMGRSLTPAISLLQHMAAVRRIGDRHTESFWLEGLEAIEGPQADRPPE